MIEVLFGESEAASMKAAKSTIVTGKTNGPTSVWLVSQKKPPTKPSEGWISGTAKDVICLVFMLDIGDIKEELDSQYRKELIYSMYSQGQWGNDSEMDTELQKAHKAYVNEWKRLKEYLENGEAVRVWYSDASYSRCGFYNLCSMLENFDNEIHVVKMPEYVTRGNSTVIYQNWGEVAAEEFSGFLPYEKILSTAEIRMYSFLWKQLKEENKPLRATVNGKLVSVPESFYDFLILQRLTVRPIKEARLIGDILGHYPIGIGDWWYAKRIDYLIAQGKIKVMENSEKLYARTICLA